MLTIPDVARALPGSMRSAANQQLVDTLNNISQDPELAQNMRDNFISYSAVLKDGKFKMDDYISAVMYVSFKLMGYSNQEAYSRTFPQRHSNMIATGKSAKDISAYVAAYSKGKLVNLIMEQTLVPSWVLNQDLYQKALNVQADLMVNAVSEKVRTDAANSILTHLKKPEATGLDIKLTMEDNSGMSELKDTLTQLAQQQREMIENGLSAKTIAATPINRRDAEDV